MKLSGYIGSDNFFYFFYISGNNLYRITFNNSARKSFKNSCGFPNPTSAPLGLESPIIKHIDIFLVPILKNLKIEILDNKGSQILKRLKITFLKKIFFKARKLGSCYKQLISEIGLFPIRILKIEVVKGKRK